MCGHNILPWKIHGGKTIYAQKKSQENQNMEEDVFAVEVFHKGGNGSTYLDMDIKNHSHYTKPNSKIKIPLFTNTKTNKLTQIIKNHFNTLAFCPRFINYQTQDKTNVYS